VRVILLSQTGYTDFLSLIFHCKQTQETQQQLIMLTNVHMNLMWWQLLSFTGFG